VTLKSVEHGLALMALGELASDEIPDLALLLLEDGCALPAMAALASGTPSDDPVEVRADFVAALRSTGHAIPGRIEAARTVMRICAKEAVAGERPLRDAAREIIWTYQEITQDLSTRSYVLGEDFGIAGLVGAYYSYDDVPVLDESALRELDSELLAELRKLVSKSGA
jgi:hypothetical protein